MNEENDDFYIEEELNDLPGYIQAIINECDTFDKKDNSNQNKENFISESKIENKNINTNINTNINENSTEKKQNSPNKTNNINENKENNDNNDINDNDDEIYFDDDKENDSKIENIFNSKKDFFNPKISDEDSNLKNNNEFKENININIEKTDKNNNNDNINKNNSGIKLYCIQENNLLNIKRSYRLQSILQNNVSGYQNNTCECSICFRRIQNYGLLSNCDDVFCYDCIKQWRTEAISKNKREMFRRCPICNCESPMLIKSKNYISGEEKRKKFYELKQEKKISQSNQ